MARKIRPSVQKREREQKKRQRELRKAEKAAEKREQRFNRAKLEAGAEPLEGVPEGEPASNDSTV